MEAREEEAKVPDAGSLEAALRAILEPADMDPVAAWGPVGIWGDERAERAGGGDGSSQGGGEGVEGRGTPRVAAVLVPFVKEGDGMVSLLFTLRTMTVKDHKGQVSFPGGTREEADDTLLRTALRETEEEIGIAPAAVKVAGRLRPYDTVTGYRIHPFVGIIEGRPSLTPSEVEIDRVFHVPLATLMDPAVYRESRVEWGGKEYTVRAFEWRGPTIWGATANILTDLVARLRAHLGGAGGVADGCRA